MKVFMRICLRDTTITDGDKSITLKRGEEYTTSREKDGRVHVFSRYWFWCDADIFGGAQPLSS